MGKYDNIIHMQRPMHPENHPPMSISQRAAQFIGFKAIAGHEELIEETGRHVEQRIELDEAEKAELDNKLRTIMMNLDEMPLVTVEYFNRDPFKYGGEYVSHAGIVEKVNTKTKAIEFDDGFVVNAADIISIESDIFSRIIW